MLARMWSKRNTPSLLMVLQACTSTLEIFWWCLRKLDLLLPEDPAILLLGIYPEDVPTGKKVTCSTMFIAALFILARSWKWYIYTMEYYSAIKKNEFMKFLGK